MTITLEDLGITTQTQPVCAVEPDCEVPGAGFVDALRAVGMPVADINAALFEAAMALDITTLTLFTAPLVGGGFEHDGAQRVAASAITADIVGLVFADQPIDTLWRIARENPALPANRYLPDHVARTLAMRFDADVALLRTLSEHTDFAARAHVARHENTPPELLAVLADDRNSLVRMGVARNPNAPRSLVERLSNDRTPEVRSAAEQELRGSSR